MVRDLLRWQVKYGSLASRCADARWHTYRLGRLAEVRDDPFTTLASHLVSQSPMDPSDRVELLRALRAGDLVELPS